jgi:hypothetical protein
MKKYIITLALVISQMTIMAQTVNVHLKNGQTIEYPSDNVDYVDFSIKTPEPTLTAGQVVDLGLSVCWASCNLGAEKQEEYGNYYAWGETITKNDYTNGNYSFYNSSTTQYTNIGNNISGTEYDAATVNLGNEWRIPTREEMQELIKKCKWEWAQINGNNGYIVTGLNGNSIFLPAAGTSGIYNRNVYLQYSTSTSNNSTSRIYSLEANSIEINCASTDGYMGYSIRPVTINPNYLSDAQIFANKLTINGTTATWEGTEQRQFKELGSWSNKIQSYVVIRFDRNSTTDIQGTGVVLTFQNSYKEEFKERSEFTWSLYNDRLNITYSSSGWQPVYGEYRTNELIIDNSGFKGFWFETTDTRYQFSYIKSNFTDWDKYKD